MVVDRRVCGHCGPIAIQLTNSHSRSLYHDYCAAIQLSDDQALEIRCPKDLLVSSQTPVCTPLCDALRALPCHAPCIPPPPPHVWRRWVVRSTHLTSSTLRTTSGLHPDIGRSRTRCSRPRRSPRRSPPPLTPSCWLDILLLYKKNKAHDHKTLSRIHHGWVLRCGALPARPPVPCRLDAALARDGCP
jgi:hypothetical protein